MGLPSFRFIPDTYGALAFLLGLAGQVFACRRLGFSKHLTFILALAVTIPFLLFGEYLFWMMAGKEPSGILRDWVPGLLEVWSLFCVTAGLLLLIADRLPPFSADRRNFLRVSTATACAVPAAVFGGGIITRKDFHINEVDIHFPSLPKDLEGLRLLQISDIHLSSFFSREDLARVVDASNGLRPDVAFVTGDLITAERDPLDDCLAELARLRSQNGVYGCMGNHEMYAGVQNYTKAKAMESGMDFLRYENRLLRFGDSRLNLVGVDYQGWQFSMDTVDRLVVGDSFNLLLAHTPQVFPQSGKKGFQLTLSGHTHGGQINLELLGANLNLVDLQTKYTKGLYDSNGAKIYVNSGLGTIGVPIRIGAPPEITVIRLCNS